MKEEYKDIFFEIVSSPNQDVLVNRLCSFCDHVYFKFSKLIKERKLDKERLDYILVITIEEFNKEVNEVVDEINKSNLTCSMVSNNLLYGLIGTYNKLLWELFKQRYVEVYN